MIELVVNPALTGQKHAVMLPAGKVAVSPAMFDLMRHANQRELAELLKSIKVVKLDGKPEHDPQWWADTWQIEMERWKNSRQKISPGWRE